MGVLYGYLAADSDERAAGVLDLAGGAAGSAPDFDPGLPAAARAYFVRELAVLARDALDRRDRRYCRAGP